MRLMTIAAGIRERGSTGRARCTAPIALAMVVAIDFDMQPPLVSLILIDVDQGRDLGRLVKQLESVDDAAVGEGIRSAADNLFDRAGLATGGRALLNVLPADAELAIDPPAKMTIESAPSGRVLKIGAGTYPLKVTHAGYDSRELELQIRARDTPPAEV